MSDEPGVKGCHANSHACQDKWRLECSQLFLYPMRQEVAEGNRPVTMRKSEVLELDLSVATQRGRQREKLGEREREE